MIFDRLLPQARREVAPASASAPGQMSPAIPGNEERYLTSSAFVPPGPMNNFGVAGQGQSLQNLAVFACMRILADAVASCPFWVYRDAEDELPRRLRPSPVLVRKPVPDMDLFAFKWFLMSSLALRGNAYLMITARNREFYPTGLMPLHPDAVHVETRPGEAGDWWAPIYRVNGEPYTGFDIIHIRRFTVPGEAQGLSPIGVAMRAIDLGLTAEEYGLRYFKESANPSSILRTEQNLDDNAIKQAREQWIKSQGGRRRPAILSGGWDWKPISIAPNESQFLETRGFSYSDIAMMYGVPPHMLGMTDKSTSWGSGIEAQGIGFNVFTLNGWFRCIESVWTSLFPQPQYVLFDPSALLRGDFKTRVDGYHQARLDGWLNADEIRRKEGLPPIEDPGDDPTPGQMYWQPVNVAPLGHDPAEANANAAAAAGAAMRPDPNGAGNNQPQQEGGQDGDPSSDGGIGADNPQQARGLEGHAGASRNGNPV